MLEEVKKIQGINHCEFDNMINTWIDASKKDLINIGVKQNLVNEATDSLIRTTIIQFVLSQLDVTNSELYSNSYVLLKDTIRRVGAYMQDGV